MSDANESQRDEAQAPSDETQAPSDETQAPSDEAQAPSDEAQAPSKERVDEDGLPLDRDATIDDVRSKEARHGRFAVGCTLLIVLLIAAFWAVRGGFIG